METLSTAAAERLLSLFSPDLDGARSALETCYATQTILRDRVAELEQERNPKQTTASPPEESRIVKCGSDPLLLVCSFLRIKDKFQFRITSLGVHSALLGCAIDLTESVKTRHDATIEFVLERFVPFRMYSNRNYGHEACSCVVARTISDLKVGTCLKLAAQYSGAEQPKARDLEKTGFGRSWSIVGLSFLRESDAEMLPKLLSAIQPNQIKKVAIGSRSAGILTAIGQAVERGGLTGLQEIDFHYEDFDDEEGDEVERSFLGFLSYFGPAFHRLILSDSQIQNIAGLERCKKLRTLHLVGTQVADVSALGSCRILHTLYLNYTQVADISALGSCSSLHTLDLEGTQVTDVSALGSCRSLCTLRLISTEVADVSVLGSCSNLHTLNLNNTQVADVSTLGSCSSLHKLSLHKTKVADVSVLRSCSRLHTLDLRHTQVTDVSALGSCSSLHKLFLSNTQVADVSVLRSCSRLQMLFLSNTQVADVSVLRSCSRLHTLDLASTQVADVSALGSCSSLHTLYLASTQVTDISALGSCCSLHTLDLNDTQVVDVSALGSCSSLHTVILSSRQVAGVSALGSCRVEYYRRYR